jgi:hypothetical protein
MAVISEFLKVANLFKDLNLVHIGKKGVGVADAKGLSTDVAITTLDESADIFAHLKDKINFKELNVILYRLDVNPQANFFKSNLLKNYNDQFTYITYNCTTALVNYLYTVTKKQFSNIYLQDRDINEVVLENIVYHGMIVKAKNDDTPTSMRGVLKYLIHKFVNKRVLVICATDNLKKELLESGLKEDKSFTIETEGGLSKLPKGNKFDIVIEYPFIDSNRLLEHRLLVVNSKLNGIFITLFQNQQFQDINDINLHHHFQIKIGNLLSERFLGPEEKWDAGKIPQRLINVLNEIKYDSDDKKFQDFYDKIKINESIIKQIAFSFYKQNYKKIISENNENISILTGEPGYRTFLATCISSKQKEE